MGSQENEEWTQSLFVYGELTEDDMLEYMLGDIWFCSPISKILVPFKNRDVGKRKRREDGIWIN